MYIEKKQRVFGEITADHATPIGSASPMKKYVTGQCLAVKSIGSLPDLDGQRAIPGLIENPARNLEYGANVYSGAAFSRSCGNSLWDDTIVPQ
ncbi:MAG: hypothetical protein AAGB11_00740 [Pseudomonadota bacterium]